MTSNDPIAGPLLAATHSTPAGPFTLVSGRGGVCAAGFTADVAAVAALRGPLHRADEIRVVADTGDASKAVLAWSDGDVDAPLAVDVALEGTDFQRSVWAALRGIAPGRPLSYAGLAAAAGRPAAVRAAGRGCATNRVSLFVPCHRVVPSGGGVGGFLWGAAVKEALLAHEDGQMENGTWRSNASSTLPMR
jgi:methylated-DNA-[protein]-cysteine S-methyltransferase